MKRGRAALAISIASPSGSANSGGGRLGSPASRHRATASVSSVRSSSLLLSLSSQSTIATPSVVGSSDDTRESESVGDASVAEEDEAEDLEGVLRFEQDEDELRQISHFMLVRASKFGLCVCVCVSVSV